MQDFVSGPVQEIVNTSEMRKAFEAHKKPTIDRRHQVDDFKKVPSEYRDSEKITQHHGDAGDMFYIATIPEGFIALAPIT